jgi:hypothetical protein
LESKLVVDGMSSKSTLTTVHEFGDSTSSTRRIWELKPEVDGISSTAHEFDDSLSSTSSKNGAPII